MKKELLKDSSLNIIASTLLTFVVQIIIFPFLASNFTLTEYGLILTIIGALNAIGVALGNSLNNSRLLRNEYYIKSSSNGDYNPIFLFTLFVSSIAAFMLTREISDEKSTIILSIFLANLILFRSYFSVTFRLHINYKKIIKCNLYSVIGYLLGLIIFSFYKSWIVIFLLGELFACIYICLNTTLIKEKFQITKLFKGSIKNYFIIFLGTSISSVMLYMDRFLIFPLIGSNQVAIFTVASFLGKTMGVLLNPISSVLLTYLIKVDNISKKFFYKNLTLLIASTLIFFFFVLIIDEYILMLLYPDIIELAKPYLFVANLSALLMILANMIHPLMLRFCKISWQPILQSLYLVLYVCFGLYGITQNGLMGFCWGIIAATIIKILIMILILHKSLKS